MSTNHWCTVWGNAMSITDHRVGTHSKDITLRYPITLPFAGEKIRITLDNFCGTEDVRIEAVTIACSAGEGSSIDSNTITKLTFDGNPYVEIKAGCKAVSDEVDFVSSQNKKISISIYIKEATQMRSSVIATGPLSKGYYSVGDKSEMADLPQDDTRNTNCFYFLSDVEIYTDTKNAAVICYGDSITAQSWPDYLALMFLANPDNNKAVVRKATSGSRILRQYSCITYESYGLKGDVRFPHEIPVSGATDIIIQQGINDIIHPVGVEVNPFRPMSDLPTVPELIDGLKYYIDSSIGHGLNTYVGTLLPIEGWRTYADFRETMKNEYNEWIRNNTQLIDFDRAVRNPERMSAFGEGMDSGDHLHPSEKAYEEMAKLAYATLIMN
ncbi:MAG: SGNH/GDSL hydrolase family protein [Clostridia bacterium]|nr:SGNH/GDSL hydrolase family protein [Clostridia bacterium]